MEDALLAPFTQHQIDLLVRFNVLAAHMLQWFFSVCTSFIECYTKRPYPLSANQALAKQNNPKKCPIGCSTFKASRHFCCRKSASDKHKQVLGVRWCDEGRTHSTQTSRMSTQFHDIIWIILILCNECMYIYNYNHVYIE